MEPNQEPKDQTESKDDIDWKKIYMKKPFGLKQSTKEYIVEEEEKKRAKERANEYQKKKIREARVLEGRRQYFKNYGASARADESNESK